MTPLERAVVRFLALWAITAGVELVERVAYRAGVDDGLEHAADVLDDALAATAAEHLDDDGRPVDDDDDLEPFDATDVLWLHITPGDPVVPAGNRRFR